MLTQHFFSRTLVTNQTQSAGGSSTGLATSTPSAAYRDLEQDLSAPLLADDSRNDNEAPKVKSPKRRNQTMRWF